MSQVACIEMGWYMSWALEDPRIGGAVQRLRAENAPIEAYVELLASEAPPEIADNIRLEFAELPALTLDFIIQSWALAHSAGKRFEVQSVRPEAPRDFARNRRVRVAVDAEEDVVRVTVSHVATRHALWYRPAVAV